MILPLQTDPLPLHADGGGGFRVGDSRVPLDVVLNEYNSGAAPESIVNAYPALHLEDVYAVLAFYLRHRQEMDAHLRQREEEAAKLRREIESRQPDKGQLRDQMLARRRQQEQENASARG